MKVAQLLLLGRGELVGAGRQGGEKAAAGEPGGEAEGGGQSHACLQIRRRTIGGRAIQSPPLGATIATMLCPLAAF